jgi:hypothetical protein
MESPTYLLIACNKLDGPLYFLVHSRAFSNMSAGCIEFKGSGNNGHGSKETSNSFILLFNSEFYFSILSIDFIKYSLVVPGNSAFFYDSTPTRSIEYLYFFDDVLFLVLTFSNNNFLVSGL